MNVPQTGGALKEGVGYLPFHAPLALSTALKQPRKKRERPLALHRCCCAKYTGSSEGLQNESYQTKVLTNADVIRTMYLP